MKKVVLFFRDMYASGSVSKWKHVKIIFYMEGRIKFPLAQTEKRPPL